MNTLRLIQLCTILQISLFAGSASALALCDAAFNSNAFDDKYLQSFRGLTQGHHDWLFRRSDLIVDFGPDPRGLNGLENLYQALEARGTQLILVPVPTRGIVHPEYLGSIDFDLKTAKENYHGYLDRLRAIGFSVPRLEKLLDSDHPKLFFARDHHWTPEGARQVARLVADAIRPARDATDDQTYSTIKASVRTNNGSYQKAAARLCPEPYPAEHYQAYSTISNSNDLFAVDSDAEIVLVGTSNSNSKLDLNFAGFLQEYLGEDVINLAMSGGRYNKAIESYLSSDSYHTKPARLIIWEVPGYYRLNKLKFYQKILDNLEWSL